MDPFTLHPRLAADTVLLGALDLSDVRLLADRRWPWLVLVPRRTASEIHDLDRADRVLLAEEIAAASSVLKESTGADKINVGALGNLVPQLHVHVIARRRDDPAWPGPAWGFGAAEPYGPGEGDELARRVRSGLALR